ncbi:MAG: Ig-like domain-containing protein, partial [Casimicrobiaceae bacterium]
MRQDRPLAATLRRGIVRLGLALLYGSLACAVQAAEHRFQILLDTDNNPSTGCDVSTVKGVATGIEQVWTTVVTTTASDATVTRIERQTCIGTTLGASSTFAAAGWAAGLGNGTSGTAAIETYIPLSLLPVQGTMRVLLASSNATGGQDATSSFPVAVSAAPPPPPGAGVQPIPLSPWLILPLGALLLVTVAWASRRYPGQWSLVVCIVLVAASGLVWAASVTLDGNVSDWSGLAPVAGNAKGSAPIDANIVAVFHQSDAANLYFRADADVRPDGVANQTPVVAAGADQAITLPAAATLNGSASDDGLPNPPGTLTTSWSKFSGPGSVVFGDEHALATTASFSQNGVYTLRLNADDGSLSASDDVQITVNAIADQPPVAHDDSVTTFPGSAVQLNVLGNDTDADADSLTVASFSQGTNGSVACTAGGACTYTPSANFSGQDSFTYTASDGRGGQATATVTVDVSSVDTTVNAPPLTGSFITTLGDATKFLYSGTNPLQTGVGAGTIEPRRVAVLRGKVTTRDGNQLPGVTVTVLDHPELGQTVTRSNGRFDMVVNGGGLLTIDYAITGFLPLQKQVRVPWQDYVAVPTVALIPVDAQVTSITANAGAAQLHQASVISDNDGTRRAIVFFPAGTTAIMTLPNGSTQPLSTMHIRATEYTVGANGPAAMPANLPPLSGYTYCIELSADEAIAAGAVGVVFSQPVVTYVENFLQFPVGLNVPVGVYDRAKGFWVPSLNGRVVKILGSTAGLANVDTDGDNVADSGLGITTEERASLASLYSAGQTLWRVPVAHFSPEDSNWPYTIPDDAVAPGDNGAGPDADEPLQDPTCSSGSIVECENRVLGESVPIVGTPYTLNYRSDRVPGQVAKRTIRLSGGSVPASLASIDMHLAVAGRTFDQTFAAAPNQQMTFVWDRLDAYGRQVLGGQTLSVKIDYNYPTTYKDPGPQPTTFNSIGGVTLGANPSRQRVAVSQSFTTTIGEGLTDARPIGLGGWTLSGHNVYDPNARVAHFGNGSRRRAGSLARTLTTIDLPGQSVLFDVEVGPDGSQYVLLPHGDRVVRIAPDGTQSFVAGNGTEGFSGDGGPATQAMLGDPTGIAVAPDGSLYIAEESNFRVRKVAPDGTISTVAGTGVAGFSGDGGPAAQAQLSFAERVAVAPDSTLYILDSQRVRRVGTDGIINTVAGDGSVGGSGDGGPATAASLNASSLTAAPDGGFYITDFGNERVRRVDANGIINTVADYTAESGRPVSVRPTADGSLLVALEFGTATTPRVDLLKPDGSTVTVAGGGPSPIQEGIPATQANLVAIRAVAVAPDGSIFIARGDASSRLLRIGPALPGFEGTAYFIASADGGQLYVFDTDGKHLRTLNAFTGATLFEFGYDGNGRLTTVTEKTGGTDNVTTIEHDGSGNPTAIVGPFGQNTALAVDGNGFLKSITNPVGEALQMTSDAGGLLATYTDPRGKTSAFAFDGDGHLLQDADPAGGTQDLAATTAGSSLIVTRTTRLGRTTTYKTENLAANTQRRTTTDPDGTQSQTEEAIDAGTTHTTSSDGMVLDTTLGPDPRFGMESPINREVTSTSPGGLSFFASSDLTTTLANPADPLSILTLTGTRTVNGRTTATTYTASTKTFTTTTPAGRTSALTVDSLGRLVSTQRPGINPVNFTYDSRGRIATMTQGTGLDVRTATFTYDSDGFVQSVTDPVGRTARFAYDAAGRLTGKTFPDGRAVSFGYDAAGNAISVTPPSRPTYSFIYSDRNELMRITPPSVPGSGPTDYTYNFDKQPSTITRPDGRTIGFDYDSSGRPSARSFATNSVPTGADTLSYDSVGRLSAIAAASGVTTTSTYDGALLKTRTWSGAVSGNVTRSYDASFRVSSESINAGNTVNFTYD